LTFVRSPQLKTNTELLERNRQRNLSEIKALDKNFGVYLNAE